MNWLHAGTAFTAAFLASLVECVEALTIVLAVGTTRGWRPALLGAAASAIALVILVAIFGPALGRITITTLQLVVGILLLLFGIRWLRKAILRAAGVIALHDEARIYEREAASMRTAPIAERRPSFDTIAFLACFKAVALEGLEVIFIVLAIGAGVSNSLYLASLGALAAAAVVIALGLALRHPLSRVPENTLKLAVGIMLTAFGIFWIGEGLAFPWPGDDLALIVMIALLLLISALGVALARARARTVSPA